MATTTNYGWTTPNDTDLVKDGAAAIRTLGSSIDTTTKALNPSTTLGDIEYRSATANTNTRLGIGSNGQYLTITGGVPAWGAISAGGLTLISTTDMTGISTVTLSSIPSTYTNLLIVMRNMVSTTIEVDTLIRFNADSNANRHLRRDTTAWYDGASAAFDNTSIDTKIFTKNSGSGTDINLANFVIPDYANTSTWKSIFGLVQQSNYNAKTQGRQMQVSGLYNQTSAISSLQIFSASGNYNSGTILLYGVK